MRKLKNCLKEHGMEFGLAGLGLAGLLFFNLANPKDGSCLDITPYPVLISIKDTGNTKRELSVKKGEPVYFHYYSADKDGIKRTRVYIDDKVVKETNNGLLHENTGSYMKKFWSPSEGFRYFTSNLAPGEHVVRYVTEDVFGKTTEDSVKLNVRE